MKFYHCKVDPCPHGQDKYTRCMSQTDDFKDGCPKIKCRICGFLHKRDPFCMGERSIENKNPDGVV